MRHLARAALGATAVLSLAAIPVFAESVQDPEWEVHGWHWQSHIGQWQWSEIDSSGYAWATELGTADVSVHGASWLAVLKLGPTVVGRLNVKLAPAPHTDEKAGVETRTWSVVATLQMTDSDSKESLRGTLVRIANIAAAANKEKVRVEESLVVSNGVRAIGLLRVDK